MEDQEMLFDLKALAEYEGGEFETQSSNSSKKDEDKDDKSAKGSEDSKEALLFDEKFLAEFDESEESDEPQGGDSTQKAPRTKDIKSDLVKTLIKDLIKEGIIEAEDTELESVQSYDDIAKLVAGTIKRNELKDLTDTQKDYLTALRNGVPVEEFTAIKADIDYINTLDDSSLKDINLARNLIFHDFIQQGMDEEKANMLSDLAVSSPQYYNVAVRAKQTLKKALTEELETKVKAKETERLVKEQAVQKEIDMITNKIKETNEFFDGVKVNSQTKEKVVKSLFQPVSKKGDQLLNEVMEKYSSDADYKMKLHMLHVITNGFTDFTKLQQKLETKVSKDFDKKLEEVRFKAGTTSGNGTTLETKHNTLDRLKNLKFS